MFSLYVDVLQQGMRSVILKIGGMSVGAKKKHGFYGAKFTNIKLKFVPPFEVISSFVLFSEYSLVLEIMVYIIQLNVKKMMCIYRLVKMFIIA